MRTLCLPGEVREGILFYLFTGRWESRNGAATCNEKKRVLRWSRLFLLLSVALLYTPLFVFTYEVHSDPNCNQNARESFYHSCAIPDRTCSSALFASCVTDSSVSNACRRKRPKFTAVVDVTRMLRSCALCVGQCCVW